MRHLSSLLLVLFAFPALAAENPLIWGEANKWDTFEYAFDDTAKWNELQHQLPTYPKPENFIPIAMGANTDNQFFVDYASISAGADGVVRFSVVVKSPSGAETVNFEGMRCATGERKLYAFGRGNSKTGGEWSRNRHAKWEPIQVRGNNDFRRELFFHYFCTVEGAARLPDIQRNLKSGGRYSQD